MNQEPKEFTTLLREAASGDKQAKARLLAAAYDELRGMAASLMRQERADHTLQPTALVHEAAMRLMKSGELENIQDRSLFYWAMSRSMRCLLVDHARRRDAQRRGGKIAKVPWDAAVDAIEVAQGIDLLTLEEALQTLESLNQRQSEIVEMRFFGGFEMKEIAEHLGVSLSTVEKDWRMARAWLRIQLQG